MSRRIVGNKPPTYEALLHQLNEGGNGMPTYRDQLNSQEKADVLSYLMLGEDLRVGHTAAELAEYECVEGIVPLVSGPPSQPRPQTARPEPPRSYAEVQQMFFDIQRHLCQVQLRSTGRASAISAESARRHVTFLVDRWNRSDRETWTPSAYDGSLGNIRFMVELGANQPIAERLDAIIAEINLDLAAKERDCRDSLAGMGRVIPVSVHTVTNKDVDGWQVLYKPKLLEFWPPAKFAPFPMLSSPSKWKLPPGRYLMTARKSGVQAPPEPMTVTIGGKINGFECQIPVR